MRVYVESRDGSYCNVGSGNFGGFKDPERLLWVYLVKIGFRLVLRRVLVYSVTEVEARSLVKQVRCIYLEYGKKSNEKPAI